MLSSLPAATASDARARPAKSLHAYARPSAAIAIWQLVSTLPPFLVLWATIAYGVAHGVWPALLLVVPAALFLIRIFVLHHDCGHGSLFASRRVNDAIGFVLGLLTFTSYHAWRRGHALHHASACNLDRRGLGYFDIATVAEFRAMGRFRRARYRVLHHPLVLFGIAPALYFVVVQRFTTPRDWVSERRGALATNFALLAVTAAMVAVLGWRTLVLVEGPIIVLTASIGMWLFYTQHVFEGAAWSREQTWRFADAALHGSAHYDLPPLLRWFTADIGLHHLHHLDSRIPNYRLSACAQAHPDLTATRLTLRSASRCARLAMWDEERARMVRFDEIAPQRTATGALRVG